MKKIAITQRLIDNDSYKEIRETLDINWGKIFSQMNFLPIVLPYEIDFKIYFKKLKIDGVILSGGNDLDSLNPNNLSSKRDAYEKDLIQFVISRNIPLFGVCRGMQIIANYFGASFKKVDTEVATRHKIVPNSASKYYKELSDLKKVNSFNNYQVDSITSDFIVSARKTDGLIKAIEHKKYKIFAQMWHSEREDPYNEVEMEMIKNFFKGKYENSNISSRTRNKASSTYK